MEEYDAAQTMAKEGVDKFVKNMLAKWWEVDPGSFEYYHQQYSGVGMGMLRALKQNAYRGLFLRIYKYAYMKKNVGARVT